MGDGSILKEVTSVVVPIQKVIVHPRFSAAGTIRNDLALLQLLYPVNFTVAIQPICIPKKTRGGSWDQVLGDRMGQKTVW